MLFLCRRWTILRKFPYIRYSFIHKYTTVKLHKKKGMTYKSGLSTYTYILVNRIVHLPPATRVRVE